MRCPSREQLSAYVDKELTLSEMQKIDMHLQDCLSCKIEVSRLEKLLTNFRLLAKDDISIPTLRYVTVSQDHYKWTAVAALLLLLVGSAIMLGYGNENTVTLTNEDAEYYYKNHNNYIQNQNADFISLVSWE